MGPNSDLVCLGEINWDLNMLYSCVKTSKRCDTDRKVFDVPRAINNQNSTTVNDRQTLLSQKTKTKNDEKKTQKKDEAV